jgi:hypothetical protein
MIEDKEKATSGDARWLRASAWKEGLRAGTT